MCLKFDLKKPNKHSISEQITKVQSKSPRHTDVKIIMCKRKSKGFNLESFIHQIKSSVTAEQQTEKTLLRYNVQHCNSRLNLSVLSPPALVLFHFLSLRDPLSGKLIRKKESS